MLMHRACRSDHAWMFVILVHYEKAIEEVNVHLTAHRAWLAEQYRQGRMLVSGRRNPLVGGVLIALGDDRALIEKLCAEDPYAIAGVARHEIIQFSPAQAADAVKALVGLA